jgi:hypothetical protein
MFPRRKLSPDERDAFVVGMAVGIALALALLILIDFLRQLADG